METVIKYYKKIRRIPSLTSSSFCDTVYVAEGGGANGEVHIGRNYVWREVQH